jgi:glycerol-3-phosphate acyltransferase PlsY
MDVTLRAALAVAIGLLLGSVLPADLLARPRGVDIRCDSVDGNPGTVNAFRLLGFWPGLVTAVYDISIGVVCIAIAGALGVPSGLAYLAGLATIVGHRFPVFARLRGGGQGMAASAGLLLYGAAVALTRGWLKPADILVLLVVLAAVYAWTRSGSAAAIAMLPVLVVRLAFSGTGWQFLVFMAAVAGHIWVVQLARVRGEFAARRVREARDSRD